MGQIWLGLGSKLGLRKTIDQENNLEAFQKDIQLKLTVYHLVNILSFLSAVWCISNMLKEGAAALNTVWILCLWDHEQRGRKTNVYKILQMFLHIWSLSLD